MCRVFKRKKLNFELKPFLSRDGQHLMSGRDADELGTADEELELKVLSGVLFKWSPFAKSFL